jgi:hypothetical protein
MPCTACASPTRYQSRSTTPAHSAPPQRPTHHAARGPQPAASRRAELSNGPTQKNSVKNTLPAAISSTRRQRRCRRLAQCDGLHLPLAGRAGMVAKTVGRTSGPLKVPPASGLEATVAEDAQGAPSATAAQASRPAQPAGSAPLQAARHPTPPAARAYPSGSRGCRPGS